MKDEELKEIYGGINLSAALLNAIIDGIQALYEIGKSLSSSFFKSKCSIN